MTRSLRTSTATPWIPFRAWLLALFLLGLAISAVDPANRTDFVLEHSVTAAFVVPLALSGWRRPLTDGAYLLIFAFLALHLVGAHYTYQRVPYDAWAKASLGTTISHPFGLGRNHFDRVVHLAWGLLLFLPMREIVVRWLRLAGVRASLVAIAFLAALSSIYEMLEWLLTAAVDPAQAEMYTGQQGDLFDAQKDSFLALAGSLVAWAVRAAWCAATATRALSPSSLRAGSPDRRR